MPTQIKPNVLEPPIIQPERSEIPPKIKTAFRWDHYTCIDLLPLHQVGAGKPLLYVRPKEVCLLDEWPVRVLHLVDNYFFRDIDSTDLSKSINDRMSLNQIPSRRFDVYCFELAPDSWHNVRTIVRELYEKHNRF
ncbi:hypothetical protein COU60_03950 [Candidatus Pacearchaeota archaeon CG10_big_fil_rev_8_21_14_0_10_34_76]|nr:MAG: hypothetical protein COU60_03950 [Candidatus Pacearchaeota archaeon CG10_big_fil_rev_8_21_14_0_10_34_76]